MNTQCQLVSLKLFPFRPSLPQGSLFSNPSGHALNICRHDTYCLCISYSK